MESKIHLIYKNTKEEVEKLNGDELFYYYKYFKSECLFYSKFFLEPSIQCLNDRKNIFRIYKILEEEAKKRVFMRSVLYTDEEGFYQIIAK